MDSLDAFHLLGEILAQLTNSVEFACQLGEFVIRFGKFPLLDRLHRHGHLGLLAGVFTGEQLGGERGGLAVGKTDDRLIEAVDQLTGADLVGEALGLSVRNILAIDGCRQVDGDEVARLGRTLDALQRAKPGAQARQFGVDLLIGDLDRVH